MSGVHNTSYTEPSKPRDFHDPLRDENLASLYGAKVK